MLWIDVCACACARMMVAVRHDVRSVCRKVVVIVRQCLLTCLML